MTDLPYLPWRRPTAFDDRPCVQDEHHTLTHAEFGAWVEAVAEQYAERGVTLGTVVAIMLPNRVELLVAMVAAWRLGAAATPINPVFTAHEADYQIRDADAVLVVNDGPDSPDAGRPTIAVDDLRRSSAGTALPAAPTEPDELAMLIYTSGSTGRPKGVMLSHANLDAMSSQMAEAMRFTEDDHCLLLLPLFHANALFVSFLTPIRVGARLSILGRFSVAAFVSAIERLRPTYFSAVPTIYTMLISDPAALGADYSSLRFGLCGAAPASRQLLAAVEEKLGFGLIEGYGLTEGACASAVNPLTGPRKLGTVGVALPGQVVAVMSEDGGLLAAGERGEVVIRGDNVMVGYLGRPEATNEALRDGWLHTGDIGILDEEGYLRIVDRIKDLIIRGGENLYPKEIEAVLTAQQGVLEAAVVGVPDDIFGEVPVAYVTTYPMRASTQGSSERSAVSSSPASRFRSPSTSSTPYRRTPSERSTNPLSASCPALPLPLLERDAMPFLTPVSPDIDPDDFVRRPFLERIRITSTFWAENGFGTPRMVHVIYLVKVVVFYTLGGLFLISATTDVGGISEFGSWWDEPIVYQKVVLWTLLVEVMGLGGTWGPLCGRFKPMTGGNALLAPARGDPDGALGQQASRHRR